MKRFTKITHIDMLDSSTSLFYRHGAAWVPQPVLRARARLAARQFTQGETVSFYVVKNILVVNGKLVIHRESLRGWPTWKIKERL